MHHISIFLSVDEHILDLFRLLSGNPLQCACENIWIKVWLDESERESLQCLQEGGRAEFLSGLTLPSCGNSNYVFNAYQNIV